jgi:hypothetical protein
MIARLFSPLAAKILLSVVGALLISLAMARCTIDRQADKIATLKADVAKVRGVLDQANENHRLTKTRYSDAQTAAAIAHQANLDRIARARDAINQRTIDELESRRRAAVAGLARLRAQSRTFAEGLADHPDLAAHADATCRAYAGTGCHEIPAILGAAQANTDQLIAFQNWARANLNVPLNAAENGEPQ